MQKYLNFSIGIAAAFIISTSCAQAQVEKLSFYPEGMYDQNIPTPESVLGFPIGERPVRYTEAILYLNTLAEKSPEVNIVEFGATYEQRKLYHLIISSKENLAKVEENRTLISKLSDPRKTTDAEANKIIETTPAIAWMAYSIHGDELSGVDAAVQLAYHLAAGMDTNILRIKRELIVLIDPMENPDGRERYLAQMQQWAGEVVNSDVQHIQHTGVWPWGRGNHYLFDMNRDWFLLVHPESRARVTTILQWNPQVLVDAHEMGSYDTYLFTPSGPPYNPNIIEFNLKWRRKFAADQAKAFDRYGWSYYTREWTDEWYPGYGSAWPLYIGAVAMLYEQAQTDGTIVKRPDGSTLAFREAVHRQFTSSVANLTTAAVHRKELLKDYYEAKKSDLRKLAKETYFLVPGANQTRVHNLLEKLLLQNIEIKVAAHDFRVPELIDYWKSKPSMKTLPKGTYIISLDQPMGRLAKAILEFDPRMDNATLEKERKLLEKEKRSMMYDVTGWSLAIAYGVECYWTDKKFDVNAQPLKDVPVLHGEVKNPLPAYGYLFSLEDDKSLEVVAKLLEKGYRLRSAKEHFEIEGHAYNRGTILIRLNENDKSITEEIRKVAESSGITVNGVNTALSTKGPDLGGNDFVLLTTPRIALVTGTQFTTMSFSALWHLLDYRMKQRATVLVADGFHNFDLRKYNVLILPSSTSPKVLNQLLGKDGIEKLKNWIENGGTLIGIDHSAAFLADTATGLSKVRLRHQVLAELEIYADWLKREEQAKKIKVDSVSVWDGTVKSDTAKDKKLASPDVNALEREDEWLRRFTPRGAILSVDVDSEHWLAYGTGDRVPTIFNSTHALLAKDPVQAVGRFSAKEKLRISGLVWPEAKERWAKTAFVTREALGDGQIILFAEEPNFRAYFYATERLLLNAIFLGPGFGTSRMVEW